MSFSHYKPLLRPCFEDLLELLATQELFSEIGELIRYAIHYDKNGRPSVSVCVCSFNIGHFFGGFGFVVIVKLEVAMMH